MSQHQALGVCPHCEATISRGDVLIEYERRGQTARYADCPGCGRVVHPD
ncbi:MAG: hypothetical protein ABEJ27_05790 [Halodesulfurarchaeum sp.]